MSVKNSSLMRLAGIHINHLQDPKSSCISHNRYRNSRHHSINIVGGVFEALNRTENGNQVHQFYDETLVEGKVALRTAMWVEEVLPLIPSRLLLHCVLSFYGSLFNTFIGGI